MKKSKLQKAMQTFLDVDELLKKIRKDKPGVLRSRQYTNFAQYIEVAGYNSDNKKIHKGIIKWSLQLAVLGYVILFIWQYGISGSFLATLLSTFFWLLIIVPVSYAGVWLTFYVATDFTIARRREAIEHALPDYLQLAASNIRAGIPIDRALWLAIRPRFGILAHEMEMVAKQTISGEKLETALLRFSHKYDSAILSRTVMLIIEGLRAGSEVGALLENIALDINDMYERRATMAANVTQYLIFITFAVAVASPLLFGMSLNLLSVLNSIGSQISTGEGSAFGDFSLNFSGDAVSEDAFFIFCVVSIISSSIFSGLIVSTIKHGNARDMVKLSPTIAVIGLVLFLISSWGIGLLFEGLI